MAAARCLLRARRFLSRSSPPPPPPKAAARVSGSKMKENWLGSLSCPFPGTDGGEAVRVDPGWVIGIDPNLSGALAVLKPEPEGVSAQVFDNPVLQVLVGKKVRKWLDTRSIVQLLRSFDAPVGTTAYIEPCHPAPQDAKQRWYSGGFTYGLWIGILVASGFSVVPVCRRLWKDQFELYNCSSTKDESRNAALILFPSLSSSLKRKKDHGRAGALLIAAYGRGLKLHSSPSAV